MAPRNRYGDRVVVLSDTVGPTMTKQSMKDQCDVNKILRQFDTDGVLSHLSQAIPQYAQFTEDELIGSVDFDYHAALNIVRAADDAFSALPADLRKRFWNDPGEFLAFVDDPSNRDEAVRLGLVAPRPVVPAAPVSEEGPPPPVREEGSETS